MLAIGLLVVIFVPGLLALRALGLRGLTLWGAAPAWTAGLATAASLVLAAASVRWSPLSFAAVILGATVLAALVGRFIPGKVHQRVGISLDGLSEPVTRRQGILLGLLIVISSVLLWLPGVMPGDFGDPPQWWDPTYHLSGVWSIADSGNASPLSAFSLMYGPEPVSVVYPAVLHQLVSLVSGTEHIIPTIKLMLAGIAIIWYTGIASLGQAALPKVKYAPFLALGAAQFVPIMPSYLLFRVPVWANALGVALIPGLLALAMACFRYTVMHRRNLKAAFPLLAALYLMLVLGILGLTASYPASFFTITIILIVGLTAHVAQRIGEIRSLPRAMAATAGLALLIGLTLILPLSTPQFESMLANPPARGFDQLVFKLWSIASMNPAGGGGILPKLITVTFGIACLVGLVTAFRSRQLRWLSLTWIVFLLIVLATSFPIIPLSYYTGIWYYGIFRTLPFFAMPSILLAVIGASRLLPRATATTLPHAVLGVLVLSIASAAIFWGMRYGYGREMFAPKPSDPLFMVSDDELAMQKRIAHIVGPDELVIGDPTNGAALLPAYANVDVAYRQHAYAQISHESADARLLGDHFNEIHDNPRVCRVLKKYNINYFYEDYPVIFNETWRPFSTPGFYHVDTSKGFELLDEADQARFYRITACDD